MGTCGTHNVELVTGFGKPFCPSCMAEGVEAQAQAGELPPPSSGHLAVPAEGKKLISIRFAPRDLERARVFAKRQGMPYQTYLGQLLKNALDAEEKDFLELPTPAPRGRTVRKPRVNAQQGAAKPPSQMKERKKPSRPRSAPHA